jgi:hypothetical protein
VRAQRVQRDTADDRQHRPQNPLIAAQRARRPAIPALAST